LSHSAGLAVLAFSSEGEVGIDFERSVPLRLDELSSAGFLSERELDTLVSLGGRGLQEALLRCWVRKEALVKATGEGMGAPLTEIEVPLAPGRHTLVRPLLGEEEARRWSLSDVRVAPGYAACLVVEGEAQIRIWNWGWSGGALYETTPEWGRQVLFEGRHG
jgi:4'-phosphopantetheinyl transferase